MQIRALGYGEGVKAIAAALVASRAISVAALVLPLLPQRGQTTSLRSRCCTNQGTALECSFLSGDALECRRVILATTVKFHNVLSHDHDGGAHLRRVSWRSLSDGDLAHKVSRSLHLISALPPRNSTTD